MAQGAEVIQAAADPLSVGVKGQREAGAGEFPLLLRDLRIRSCKDLVRGPGGDLGGNGGCKEGF